MKSICFNSCLNTNEMERFFPLLFYRHVLTPLYAGGTLETLENKVTAVTHSLIHSFIRQLFLERLLCARHRRSLVTRAERVRVGLREREKRAEARAHGSPTSKGQRTRTL